MKDLTFSGHESFICKQFWLKKVYDFALTKKSFNDETAVVELGVGKNMVASLRYWGKAFGILNDQTEIPTEIAEYLFGKKGKDIYLEDFATIWLLHYQLVKSNRFSVASMVFNEFRKERVEFTKEQLVNFFLRKTKEYNVNTDNPNTIERDVNAFIRTYSKPQHGDSFEIEDDFSGILIDLDLLKRYKQRGIDGKLVEWNKIEVEDRVDLPFHIVLYAILENYGNQKTITFRELLTGLNGPGAVFALNADGLYNKLQQIANAYKGIVYTETAGNQVLQIKSNIDKYEILNDYYG